MVGLPREEVWPTRYATHCKTAYLQNCGAAFLRGWAGGIKVMFARHRKRFGPQGGARWVTRSISPWSRTGIKSAVSMPFRCQRTAYGIMRPPGRSRGTPAIPSLKATPGVVHGRGIDRATVRLPAIRGHCGRARKSPCAPSIRVIECSSSACPGRVADARSLDRRYGAHRDGLMPGWDVRMDSME